MKSQKNAAFLTITTHIAGLDVVIGGRVIQRCAVCGEKLCDSRGAAMPLRPDGTVPEYATWAVGSLVRVKTGLPVSYVLVDHKDGDQLPKDSCIDLVE